MKFLSTLLLLFFCVCSFANSDKDTLKGLELEQAKLPIFNKDRLQLVAFCDRASQQGDIMTGTDTVLDIIRKDADGDNLKDGWDLPIYPLHASLEEIVKFWAPRLYSEGVVRTARMDINQKARTASGDQKVFFRSTALDLNGVGFDSDFKRRTIFVRSDVRVILRMAECDPRNILKKKKNLPAKRNFLRATSTSLLVDSENDQVMLIGAVKVYEGDSRIECDRMTVILNRKKDKKSGGSLEDQMEGISRILCDGNVKITNLKKPDEKAFADHLQYDVKSQTVQLSGDEQNPVIHRGKESVSGKRMVFFRDGEKAVVFGGCLVKMVQKNEGKSGLMTITSDTGRFYNEKNHIDFLGNVKVDDPRMTMTCDRMRVLLYETAAKPAVKKQEKSSSDTLTGLPEFGSQGSRELDQIKCRGNVRIVHKQEKNTVSVQKRKSAMYRWVQNGDRAAWELCSGAKETAVSQPVETVIDSDSCDIDYRGNVICFKNNVKLRDARVKVDCTWLYLYLKKKQDSSDKTIERIVCKENVYLAEENGEMWTDVLTLYFREVPAGRKGKPGMFEKDGVEMIKVTGDGNFKMVSRQKKGKKKSALSGLTGNKTGGAQTIVARRGEMDLLKNESQFHENVVVTDSNGVVKCQELYLYSAPVETAAQNKPAVKEPVIDDPDADPLTMGITRKNAAPEKIMITDNMELTRIVCKREVQLERKTAKGVQKAVGDMADYIVSSGEAVLTAEEGKQPWMQDESGTRMSGDKIIVNVKDESMNVVGNSRLDVKN
ncbi:MAG: hypothetical protein J6C40_09335 [Lentisphaeria bacterium]|nr:hypothetical protein [Lentisphaeria bacterium]